MASKLLMDLGFRSATTADGPRSISFWLVLSIINPLSFPQKIDLPQRISVFSPESPLKAGLLIRQNNFDFSSRTPRQ